MANLVRLFDYLICHASQTVGCNVICAVFLFYFAHVSEKIDNKYNK